MRRVQGNVIGRDDSGGRPPVIPKVFPFRSQFDLASREDAALLEYMRGVSSYAWLYGLSWGSAHAFEARGSSRGIQTVTD